MKTINRSQVPNENRIRARHNQLNPTASEARLWRELSGKRLGVSFRRQVPIGNFIVDFLCPKAKLVIEVDGASHQHRQAADARRDRLLNRSGYRVLRISSEAVLQRLPEVLAQLRAELSV